MKSVITAFLMIANMLICSSNAHAATHVVNVELKQHVFIPSTLTIPANTKVKLVIYNHDDTPEEIDSFDLNREKVIFAKSKATVFIGPLPVGTYTFFGEYHPNTANGKVIVENCTLSSNAPTTTEQNKC